MVIYFEMQRTPGPFLRQLFFCPPSVQPGEIPVRLRLPQEWLGFSGCKRNAAGLWFGELCGLLRGVKWMSLPQWWKESVAESDGPWPRSPVQATANWASRLRHLLLNVFWSSDWVSVQVKRHSWKSCFSVSSLPVTSLCFGSSWPY